MSRGKGERRPEPDPKSAPGPESWPTGSEAGRSPENPDHERLDAAERALDIVERRFHNTVERIADGILVVDVEGCIRFTNPAGERIFGRSAADLVGSELGIPIVSGETTQVDLPTPTGQRVAELRVVDTLWEDGEALLVSVRDITDRRDAEARERRLLREQLSRQQAEIAAVRARFLAEASNALSVSLERDRILTALACLVAERIGDHCLVEVTGRGPLLRLLASTENGGDARVVHRAETGAVNAQPSALARRLDGEHKTERVVEPDASWIEDAATDEASAALWRSLAPASVVAAPLLAPSGPLGIIAVIRTDPDDPLGLEDERLVSELAYRTSLALENAHLIRQAREASQAKSDFLAIVSHELRTPLTGITGYAGLLHEGVERPLTAGEHHYVDGILRNADRLIGIIDQILLFARSRSGDDQILCEPTVLADLLHEVEAVVRPLAAEAGLELEVRFPSPDVQVITDPEMVRQVLIHLATNAVKFTGRGTVTIGAETREGQTILRVTDTGRGIPSDQLDDIFEPFHQAEAPNTRVIGGTGIGLSVVQNLVRLLGGEIEVKSEPGRGSAFTVFLPQPDPQSERASLKRARPSTAGPE